MIELQRGALESQDAAWADQSWLRTESLAALAELNEQCLELLCEQAASAVTGRPRPPLMTQLEPLWRALDAPARRRAARCPFLLVDAGLELGSDRLASGALGVRERDWGRLPDPFFTVARTVSVTRLVLAYAWHLVRSEGAAARLFLGLSRVCAASFAACTLRQVMQIAENDPGLIKPRWPQRVQVWRELLGAAVGADPLALEQSRMRGLQLLAADARACELKAAQRPR